MSDTTIDELIEESRELRERLVRYTETLQKFTEELNKESRSKEARDDEK